MAASNALPAPASYQRIGATVGTSGLHVTFGPAARGQVLLAGLFAGELNLKLPKGPRKGWTQHSSMLLPVLS